MAGRLEVCVLDQIEVSGPRGRSQLGGRQQRLMMALLVLSNPHRLSTDLALEAISRGSTSGGNVLRTVVSRLRSAIDKLGGPPGSAVVKSVPAGYRVDQELIDADWFRLQEHVANGQAALRAARFETAMECFSSALALGADHPFGDVAGHPSLAGYAQTVLHQRRTALLGLLGAGKGIGQYAVAGDSLANHLAQNPYDEEIVLAMMECLYRANRRADALHTYDRLRARLGDDLGLEPTPAVRELYLAILRDQALDDLAPSVSGPTMGGTPRPPQPGGGAAGRRGEENGQDNKALEEAMGAIGPGRLVVITGPAGIGKSHLLTEMVGVGRAPAVLGHCSSEGVLPLQPFAELILDSDIDISHGAPSIDVARHQRWLTCLAIARKLDQAGPQPLVFIDDFHWADEGTTAVLGFLLDRPEPVAACVAARNLPEGHQRQLYDRLAAQGRARMIELQPLDPQRTADLVEPILARCRQERRRPDIVKLSDGVPLLALELARWTCQHPDSDQLPETLRALVRSLVAQAGRPARQLVEVAGVAGEQCEFDLLQRILGPELVGGLRLAIASGVLLAEPSQPGVVRFRHAVYRQAVLEDIEPLRLAEHHRAVARAMEAGAAGDERLLALHKLRAVPLITIGEAVAAASKALTRDLAESAWEPAVALADEALKLHPAAAQAAQLLIAKAMGAACVGNAEVASEAMDAALVHAMASGRSSLIAECLARRAILGQAFGPRSPGPSLMDQALVQLRAGSDEAALARGLAARVFELSHESIFEDVAGASLPVPEIWANATESWQLAQKFPDPDLWVEAIYARHVAQTATLAPPEEHMETCRQGWSIARSRGNMLMAARLSSGMITCAMQMGDMAGVHRYLDQLEAESVVVPTPVLRWVVASTTTGLALGENRLAEVPRLAAAALELGTDLGVANAKLIYPLHLFLHAWLTDRLGDVVEIVAASGQNHPARLSWMTLQAMTLAAAGENKQALSLLTEALAARQAGRPGHPLIWASELVLAAEAASRIGTREQCRLLIDLVGPLRGQHAVVGTGHATLGPLDRSQAILYHALGKPESAARLLTTALQECLRGGLTAFATLCRRDADRLGLSITHANGELTIG